MKMDNEHTAVKTQSMWTFLWEILKPYKWWLLLMLQAPLLSAIYVFASNYALKLLINGFSEPEVSYSLLAYPIGLFLAAELTLDIGWRSSNYAEWKAEPLARRSLLLKTYDYIQHHSYRFFQNTPSGTVVSKMKGILAGFDYVLNLHHTLIRNFFITIVSVFALWIVSTPVFIFMVVWCVMVMIIMTPMCRKLNQVSNESSDSIHRAIGLFSDNITNIFSLFSFASRRTELKRAERFISEECVPRQTAMERYDFLFCLVGGVLYFCMLPTVLLFMVYLRQSSNISSGDFLFVMLSTIAIAQNMWQFIYGIGDFMKNIGDFKSSFSILAEPHEQIDSASAMDVDIKKGDIAFKDLSFSYNSGKPIFTGLNLSIRSGEKIGLVGHSGAGKSTLVSLLLKNFKIDSGAIIVDGNNIDAITSDSLRKQIGLIPQDIMLFHRSIGENIGYGKDGSTKEEIQEAARMANIADFIETLPEKYETLVGERGVKISGGQRQRIAIARAILKNAPVIILDEATSSLDSLTEQQIQQSINLMLEKSQATVIAIAHRLSTIRHMDRIVVMDSGKIIEKGTFDELINNDGYFKKLWESQTNGMIV